MEVVALFLVVLNAKKLDQNVEVVEDINVVDFVKIVAHAHYLDIVDHLV